MDWASVGEVVKVLGPVATAGAAWFAAIIAYGGSQQVAIKPLDELWLIRVKINSAVGDLLRNKEMSNSTEKEDRALWKDWRDTAFRPIRETDAIGKLISEHVSAIEDTCRPAIEARAKLL